MDNGYKFLSETDTEVIPNLINYYYKTNDLLTSVSLACKDLKGSFAIEVLCQDSPDKIIVAKKDSPLVIGVAKDGNYIVSDYNEIYKIVDENGNDIINNNYSYIEEIDNNYYIVGINNKNGIINLSGKALIDLKYNSIFKIEGTELLQANIADSNTISLIDKNMKIIATMDNAKIQIKDNYIRIYSKNENRYFDDSGKELTAKELFTNNKLYAKLINEQWGFVDSDGNLKIQNEYDMVTEFNEYGFAAIKKDGKWGSINSNGEIVQEPIYELEGISPNFIGKYYQSEEWHGALYYTDKVEED